jgi:Asp/Glu/hydantoin racemase
MTSRAQPSDEPARRVLRIALLNPNTDPRATELMLASARGALPRWAAIEGRTAPRGSPLIVDDAALEAAADVVAAFGPVVAREGFDALIVSGFGDPGLPRLRELLPVPVVGIAECGIGEAGAGGRRYSIVTITPALHASLRRSAERYGQAANLASIRFTEGDPLALARDDERLADALLRACRTAVERDGARAIVIGGGPLVRAANAIAPQLAVPVVEPVAAAVRRLCRDAAADPA